MLKYAALRSKCYRITQESLPFTLYIIHYYYATIFLTDDLFSAHMHTHVHAHICTYTRAHTHTYSQGQIERALDGVAKDVSKVVDGASHTSLVVSGLSL